ncbi:MAG: sigma-54-dependent Fis family transcriptional regulator [Deltaproteobacteria bacterium]|nr:sigma-54-dependent Fis family transcriptional regulator [Deltaproteobacteria bacterium]
MKPKQQKDQEAPSGRILVIDDEPLALKNLRRVLEKDGHRVSTFTNPLRALKRLEEAPCDLIISDIKMPYMDGLTVLNRAKSLAPDIGVILITGYASLNGAVEATKLGAYHYLAKPFTPKQVRELVRQALREKFLRDQSLNPSLGQGPLNTEPLIIGESPKMAQVGEVIRQIAPTECNVLITGESGTGKELVARAIHAHSHRRQGPFMAFNCGAFSEELIANELFGHEKEAYTGATSRKPGLLAAANRGTLFLDEIGDMPLSMQIKLLRVIQEREVIPVGGTRPISLDIRIIAASAKDLKSAATDGAFRQDLYFRLNVVSVVLPRLAERKQDIPLLAYHMLERFRRQTQRKVRAVSQEAMTLLENYAFPGNVRELENILERAVAMCQGEVIQVRDLPPDLAELELYSYHRPGGALLNLEELERDYIRHILQLTGGVRTRAAEILGIDRASLWRKMKKYDLE